MFENGTSKLLVVCPFQKNDIRCSLKLVYNQDR